MTKRSLFVISAVLFPVVAALALWSSSESWNCVGSETAPSYSPDGQFYMQMRFKRCEDHGKSGAELLVGATRARPVMTVMLEFGPSVSSMSDLVVAWRYPGLHVEVPETSITHRFGLQDDVPPMVVISPSP